MKRTYFDWSAVVRPREAAKELNCSIPYIHKLMKQGDLEHSKLKGRVFIKIASIEKFRSEVTK